VLPAEIEDLARALAAIGDDEAAAVRRRLDEDAADLRVRPRASRSGSALPDPWDDPWDGAPRGRRSRGWKVQRRSRWRFP
jgi:hypothetical protein